MSYERNLTFNLRLRGLTEPEIAEAIDEVRAHARAAGTHEEAEFGRAEEYAKQFPKKKRRTRGTIITAIGTAISIAYVLLAVLLMVLFRVDIREFVGPNTLLPAVVLSVASVLAGFLTDYFQPAKGLSTARQGS
jgi:hypothetical protein